MKVSTKYFRKYPRIEFSKNKHTFQKIMAKRNEFRKARNPAPIGSNLPSVHENENDERRPSALLNVPNQDSNVSEDANSNTGNTTSYNTISKTSHE